MCGCLTLCCAQIRRDCVGQDDRLPVLAVAHHGPALAAGEVPKDGHEGSRDQVLPLLLRDQELVRSPDPSRFSARPLEGKLTCSVFVYLSSAAVLHKNIASWNDETFQYREGHPEKDSKAPKRRKHLMEAIEEADVRFFY
jgi:hypothetical protein